jgi:dCTP deaminase
MILSGPAIVQACIGGEIEIDPYERARVNPASYDLRLGDQVAVYSAEEMPLELSAVYHPAAGVRTVEPVRRQLDSRKRQNVTHARMDRTGFVVEPGRLYLMHTAERIHTDKYVTVIDGKSSIGRLGLMVHVTAGYGDPGFNGQYTLEVTSIAHPVVVYPGMLFCQARFHVMAGDIQLYDGNYTSEASRGPVRSASWKQFDDSK